MEIDFKNIFVASLLFGKKETTRIVFANDQPDVIATLNDYYDNPEIGFIVSFAQIDELYNLSNSREDKIFVLVIEMQRQSNNNKFSETIEWTDNIDKLHEKYLGRDYIFCDKQFIHGLALESENMLKNPTEQPLISENISI